jgi:cytochrome c biogenesis protein CcmG/thiol:disulfide interchange protein DsbE
VSTSTTEAPGDGTDLTPPRGRSVLVAAIVVGVIVALLVALLVTREPAQDRPSASPVVGGPAPALGGEALIGEPYDIGTNDRWLLVNFFATWCVPCVQEHPELRKLAEDGATAGDLNVISVVYGDKADRVEQFFEDNGGEWTVLDADEGRTALDWGVAKVPESFLVAPSGVVVERFQGGVRAADVEGLIDQYEAAADEGGS